MDPSFRTGWLVFEREDLEERRRLAQQVPDDWASMSSERLSQLCASATPVIANRPTPTAPQPVWTRPDPDTRAGR